MSPAGATVALRKARLLGMGGGHGLQPLEQPRGSMDHLPFSRAGGSGLPGEFVKKEWLRVKSEVSL